MKTHKRGGMVVGPFHSEKGGGPKFKLDDGYIIEEEGFEFNIPKEILNNKSIYEFTGTNIKVINDILKLCGLSTSDQVTDVRYGDMVICIKSAWDNTKRNFEGTIMQILSEINTSNGCNKIKRNNMKNSSTWIIRDSEAGNIIDEFVSKIDAENELKKFEDSDKEEGIFVPDFYEIVEKNIKRNGGKIDIPEIDYNTIPNNPIYDKKNSILWDISFLKDILNGKIIKEMVNFTLTPYLFRRYITNMGDRYNRLSDKYESYLEYKERKRSIESYINKIKDETIMQKEKDKLQIYNDLIHGVENEIKEITDKEIESIIQENNIIIDKKISTSINEYINMIKKENAKERKLNKLKELGISNEEAKEIEREKRLKRKKEQEERSDEEREKYISDDNIPSTINEFELSSNINSCSDLVKGDLILFKEPVFSGNYPNSHYEGDRKILGLIEKDSYGSDRGQHTFSIYVLDSEGEEALMEGDIIRRKGRTIYNNCKCISYAKQEIRDDKHERGLMAKNRKYWNWLNESEYEDKSYKAFNIPMSFINENREQIEELYPNTYRKIKSN